MNASYKLDFEKLKSGRVGSKTCSGRKRTELWVRRLAIAILIQAFRDIAMEGRDDISDELAGWREDARSWFRSMAWEPGSLKWVCSILHLDDQRLREWHSDYQSSKQDTQVAMVKNLRRMQIPY